MRKESRFIVCIQDGARHSRCSELDSTILEGHEEHSENPSQGADTITWLASVNMDIQESGQFWFDRQARSTHLLPWTREDEATRRELWNAVMKWAGLAADPDVWPMRN